MTASLSEAESSAFENDVTLINTTEPDTSEIDTTKAAEKVTQISCSEKTETQTAAPTAVKATAEKKSKKNFEISTSYKPTNISFGSAGRLDIVSVHIGVSLYLADLYDGNVQSIVDAQDSAAIFIYKDKIPVIADHNNQGFFSLKNVSVGDIAVISTPDGSKDEYICTRICSAGHNMGTYLLDEYGNDVENCSADLVMYTCQDSWRNIVLVFWQRAE